MKNKIFSAITALLLYTSLALAQNEGVSINTNGNPPDNSAILDISDQEKGLLIPRMNSSAIFAINLPANGLIVYNTDDNTLFVNIGTPTSKDWISLTPDMAVGFLVYVDGPQGIQNNALVQVQFTAPEFNHGGHYDIGIFSYVVPYDGVYQFNTGVTINSLPPATDWRIEIVVDGMTKVSSVSSPAGSFADFTGSASVTLNLFPGQLVYVNVEHRGGGPALLSSDFTRTWFSGHRLY